MTSCGAAGGVLSVRSVRGVGVVRAGDVGRCVLTLGSSGCGKVLSHPGTGERDSAFRVRMMSTECRIQNRAVIRGSEVLGFGSADVSGAILVDGEAWVFDDPLTVGLCKEMSIELLSAVTKMPVELHVLILMLGPQL